MNQLTDEQIIELRRCVVSQSGVFGSIEWCCLFARAVIEAEHKRLLALAWEPVAWLYHDADSLDVLLSNERNGLPVNSVFLGIKRREYCRNETPLYTADQLAAARLQDQQRIAELEAQLDRLMLEHCPGDMTPGQKERWAKHQQAAHDIKEGGAA